MAERLRIFISSPGDVAEERLRANLVVQKLARDYARFFRIESYLWEHEPMLASGHFQDAIEPPSACDVVVLVVYSRLGTALPERSGTREYRGLDGRVPVTGTEWEFEEALAAHQTRGAPDLLAYRKLGDPGASLADSRLRAEQERQWQALEAFWKRYFEDAGQFIAGSSKFRTLEEFDQKLETDLTALIERRIAAGLGADQGEEATWLRGSPFRGLEAYDFADAPIFFGRDGQIRAALTRMLGAAERGTAFLLVLGASGSGKSSLARAGLLPGLFGPKAVPGVGVWRRVVLRPGEGGEDPILGLARALVAGDPAEGVGLPELLVAGGGVEALAAHLAAAADDPSFPFRLALDKVATAARAGGLLPHESARLVILADQLEELFTRRIDPARRALFIRILGGLARSGVVWVVATMRNDLWHRAAETPALVDLVEHGARLDLPRPDGAEIIEIVRRPAAVAGLRFEVDRDSGVGLDATIARAASEEPGALPLLSVMLDTLFDRDIVRGGEGGGAARTFTFASYRALGELRGAIARRADDVLARLDLTDREAAAAFPQLLRSLITASGDAVTSRPVAANAFADGSPAARLAAALLAPDARLLVASASAAGGEWRLAHEALIENWPRARDQIRAERRDLDTRTRLEALLRRWNDAAAGADKDAALLTGLNLAEGVDLAERWGFGADSALGGYVEASRRRAAWRRRRTSLAAAALVLLFAGIAALAAMQWRRAEDGRAEATAQKDIAVAERGRALSSEQRAVAALRQTQRETARTLAAQAILAVGHHDVRSALELAVKAGEAERDVREPGQTPASEPALLQALADNRQVLHVRLPYKFYRPMPITFLDDDTLAYAGSGTGLITLNLSTGARTQTTSPLPDHLYQYLLKSAGGGRVAVAGNKGVAVVDPGHGAVGAVLDMPGFVNDLDVHPATRMLAATSADALVLAPLDHLDQPRRIAMPAPKPDTEFGQVRFSAAGDKIFVSYGVDVLVYDVAADRFADEPIAELDATSSGVDRALHAAMLHKVGGRVGFVAMTPDLAHPGALLVHDALQMKAIDATGGAGRLIERGEPLYLGVGFTDQARSGKVSEAVVIQGRQTETEEELRLSYVPDTGKPLPFESFSVRADLFGGDAVNACHVSPNTSFLVCQYGGKAEEGFVVWRILGVAHRLERLAATAAGSAVLLPGGAHALVSTAHGLVELGAAERARLGALAPGWALAHYAAPFAVAVQAADGLVQVLRIDDAAGAATPALPPTAGLGALVEPNGRSAILFGRDLLKAVELPGGRVLWSAPYAGLPLAVAADAAGPAVTLARAGSVERFDRGTGKPLQALAFAGVEAGPLALDADGHRLAWLDAAGRVHLTELASGKDATAPAGPIAPTKLAWSPDGAMLLIGHRDGSLLAVDAAGAKRWAVASPLAGAFSERGAWPNQPPRGAVHQLRFAADGQRFAVVRQDMPNLDIADGATGEVLTRLSAPLAYGVPADVEFGDDGLVLSTWAVHPMTRDRPHDVMLHRLPTRFDDLLALARDRLQTLQSIGALTTAPPAPPAAAAAAVTVTP